MKKLILFTIILLVASTIFAQEKEMTRKERKEAEKAEKIEKTKKLMESSSWQFDANRMVPMQGQSRTLTTSYRVILQNNQVDSHLPYVGRAYRADYGSTESPMTFRSEVEELKIEDGKKGGWILKFKAKNKNDTMNFTFTVSETGSTNLSIISTNRQSITYYGDLVEVANE